jgi:hypothetical protein
MSLSTLVYVGMLASMSVEIEGNTFLKANPVQHVTERMSEQEVQTTLLAEIEASLGTGIAAKRIAEIQGILRPMVKALPKNEHGNLEHVTVRYALHRVFVQRHGWSIKGLDSAGEGWNNTSPATGILKDQVPSFIQNMFEQRLDGKGLGLHELAVFAATIEHLIHNEAVGRLGVALKVHSMLPTDLMTEEQADTVLDTYMMAYILGENLPQLTLKTVKALSKQMNSIFLAWPETQEFLRKVTRNMTAALPKASGDAQIDFATLVKVAETVGEQFGRFQDAECKGLKTALVNIEDRGSGRVRLSSFYKPAVAGQDNGWQFQESTAYLRQLGALDDSMDDELRVMIPNYLISQTNCIASSDFYSVCCINECEDLMVQLEKSVAAPESKPEEIVKLISGLPSSSVSAGRTLSATLLTRLQDIAAQHGGMVQLHSRLFAQWMHHAYPRECPFPHVAGTTSQAKPGTIEEAVASQEELDQFGSANTTMEEVEVEDMHDLMMWTHEEELLVVRPPSMPAAHMASPVGAQGATSMFLFACVASIAYGLVHSTFGATKSAELPQKFMV